MRMINHTNTVLASLVLLFVLSSTLEAQSPTIVGSPIAQSRHTGNDKGEHKYGLHFVVNVTDPQGLSDIESVIVTGPTGTGFALAYTNNSGWYELSTADWSIPPPLGAYTFRVRDKSGNWTEQVDSVTAIVAYPTNLYPSQNDVIATTTPTFSCSAVPGAIWYLVKVADANGSQIWSRNSLTSSSVQYNDDGTASKNLVDGNAYRWLISAYDADGNYGEAYDWVKFYCSSKTTSPVLTNPAARSGHYGNDRGEFSYTLILGVYVADPQGMSDIDTVIATGPGGKTYSITDDDNDGWYETSLWGLAAPPQLGVYRFRATDKSGNWAEVLDTLTVVMDYPRNVRPANNKLMTIPSPTFSWDAVPGATSYLLWINDGTGKQIWWRDNGPNVSAVYNNDGNATESLKDGNTYQCTIQASDANRNWGQWTNRFTFSTNPLSPTVRAHGVVTYHGGNDRGSEEYGYDYWVDIIDPQGLSDIISVTMTTPDGLIYQLYDDGTWGDGIAGDGRYAGNARGLSTPSNLGQCRFVVTDKSNNTATVVDTIFAWMPFARNVRPVYNEVVQTSFPVFHWDSVAGVSSYTIRVNEGGTELWSLNVKDRTSVTYNENGTGPNLQDGNRYWWDVYAWDARGNYGYHSKTFFTYSSNATSPVLRDASVRSGHYGNDRGDFNYTLVLGVSVVDPQGLSDIATVVATGPGGKSYTIRDDDSDGWYETWFGGLTAPPQLGAYRFRATDKSGNWVEVLDTVTAVMDYPRNVRPANNELVTIPSPTFSWDAVQGATTYLVWVINGTGKQIWRREKGTTVSVVYNDDGNATESLKDGNSYQWAIQAIDADGNWGQQWENRFTYSTNPNSPILSNGGIFYAHTLNSGSHENWELNPWAIVTDPQGRADIDSVWLDGPNNLHLKLFDDGMHNDRHANDGYYSFSQFLLQPPTMGIYFIQVRDKSGYFSSVTDTFRTILDIPSNLSIPNNSIVSVPEFLISWDPVPGAKQYSIMVQSTDWQKTYWATEHGWNGTSRLYNDNGTGEALTEGSVYLVKVEANDIYGNRSIAVSLFAYRSSGKRIVYVDSASSSVNKNGTLSNPFNTISDALPVTIPGDTVMVAPGTYQGNITDVGPVTLLGKNPWTTIIRGSVSLRSTGATLKGFTIRESNHTGVEVYGNINVAISNNIITANNGTGIVHGWGGSSNVIINNNTIAFNAGDGIRAENEGSSVSVMNNIIAFNAVGIYRLGPNVTVTNKYNNYYGNRGGSFGGVQQGVGEITSNPVFADTSKKDYQLTLGSPCIDAGNPDTDGDGILWTSDWDDRDPDGTRKDIGALYFDQRTLYPATSKDLSATSADRKVVLRWSPNGEFNLAYYKIFRSVLYNFQATSRDSIAIVMKPDTSYVDSNVTNGQMYYYRIAAVNIVNNEGPPSEQATALPGQLAAPVLLTPLNAAQNQWKILTLAWNSSSGAKEYHLQVSLDSTFSTSVVDSNLTATSLRISSFLFNTTYYWRVSASNIAGRSNYSPFWKFTTISAPPATVTLNTPADGMVNVAVDHLLRWNTVTGAVNYHLQVSSQTTFDTLLVNDTTLTSTTRQVSGLSNLKTYYWRVRWKNAEDYGSFSSAWSFTTIISLPAIVKTVSPPDSATGMSINPTLQWSSVNGATNYHLQLSTSSAFTTAVFDDTTLTTTSRQISSLTNSTTYFWRVRGKNVAGYGPFSTRVSFTTIVAAPPAVVLSSPSDGATGVSINPLLKWGNLPTASTYLLQLATDSLFTKPLISDSTLIATSRQCSLLTNNTKYYWQVRAKNAGGSGAFSQLWSFTTVPIYPSTVTVSTTYTFPTKTNANEYLATEYRLIGLPGASNISVKDVVTGIQNEDWEVLWDNGASTDYLKRYDGGTDFIFGVGRAFWIISKKPLTIGRLFISAPLNTNQEAEIPLRQGWNIITNPFDGSIQWSKIQAVNTLSSSIYGFSGFFTASSTFDPFVGYYFFNGTPNPVLTTLRVPYSSIFTKVMEEPKREGWRLVIEERGETVEGRREMIEIGIDPSAREGLDPQDQRKPRMVGEATQLLLKRAEWDREYPTFASDIRPALNGMEKWKLSLVKSEELRVKSGKMRIQVKGIEQVPMQYEVFVMDEEGKRNHDLRRNPVYEFESMKTESELTIVVGEKQNIQDELKKNIPTTIEVGPNYPNPFNPETVIPITLPETMNLKVTIYDILGREVRVLHNGELTQGRHYLRWDGRDNYAKKASSGLYFYRISDMKAVAITGKMLFIQ